MAPAGTRHKKDKVVHHMGWKTIGKRCCKSEKTDAVSFVPHGNYMPLNAIEGPESGGPVL